MHFRNPTKRLKMCIYSWYKEYQLAHFIVLDKLIHTRNPYLKIPEHSVLYFIKEKRKLGYQVVEGKTFDWFIFIYLVKQEKTKE